MGKQNANMLVAIDLGSAKTIALVAEITDSGIRYAGHGLTESKGFRKGVIVDLEKTVSSVQKAVEEAENACGAPIEHALVGVAGAHIKGVNSQGGIALGTKPREIGRDEIRQAVERARAISLPADRQIVHLLPQEFLLDDQPGVREPLGMVGSRLEVKVHVITAGASATQNVVTAINRAGVHVDATVYEALASADAILRSDERELGICVADIGAGSTDLIVFSEGAVIHAGVVPIGGDHFTNDVAVGLRTPLADAEKIKRSFGCAVVTRIPEVNEIEVTSVGDRPSRLMQQRLLGEVIEPRARELFEYIRGHLRQAGVLDLCATGTVLTGGGARMPFMTEIAETVLRKPARLGYPTAIARMPSSLAEPEFSTAIGMALYGHRARLATGGSGEGNITSKLKSLFARRGA